MALSQTIAAISVSIAVAVMAAAAYYDWRDREVPDQCWWILGISGLILTGIRVMWDGFNTGYLLMLIGSAMILFDISVDIDRRGSVSAVYYVIMAVLFIVPLFIERGEYLIQLYLIPICFVIMYVLFILGILRGGADAKCFMVMAMVFQTYPSFPGVPLISLPSENIMLIISVPLALLFHAALFTVIGMLIYGMINTFGNGAPWGMKSMFWKRMLISEARTSHVWPKQDIVEGKIVYLNYVSDDKEIYDRLEAAGENDIWVTPIIPFMVPTLAALVFVIFVGNILFILL